MKIKQPKADNKSIKKAARKDIEASLVTDLEVISAKFGIEYKKVSKLIKSASKKLAKKLAKEVKFFKATAPETLPPVEEAIPVASITPAPAAKPVKKKPAPKAPDKVYGH